MKWFGRLPVEGVGVGRVQGSLGGGGDPGEGHCPGFACNNYFWSKEQMFKTCTSFTKPRGGVIGKLSSRVNVFYLPQCLNSSQISHHSVCGEVAEQYDPSSRFHMWKHRSHRGRLLAHSCRVSFLFFFLVDIICLYQSVGMCIWWNRCLDNFLFK